MQYTGREEGRGGGRKRGRGRGREEGRVAEATHKVYSNGANIAICVGVILWRERKRGERERREREEREREERKREKTRVIGWHSDIRRLRPQGIHIGLHTALVLVQRDMK